jgi:hypothetical protein
MMKLYLIKKKKKLSHSQISKSSVSFDSVTRHYLLTEPNPKKRKKKTPIQNSYLFSQFSSFPPLQKRSNAIPISKEYSKNTNDFLSHTSKIRKSENLNNNNKPS